MINDDNLRKMLQDLGDSTEVNDAKMDPGVKAVMDTLDSVDKARTSLKTASKARFKNPAIARSLGKVDGPLQSAASELNSILSEIEFNDQEKAEEKKKEPTDEQTAEACKSMAQGMNDFINKGFLDKADLKKVSGFDKAWNLVKDALWEFVNEEKEEEKKEEKKDD